MYLTSRDIQSWLDGFRSTSRLGGSLQRDNCPDCTTTQVDGVQLNCRRDLSLRTMSYVIEIREVEVGRQDRKRGNMRRCSVRRGGE